MADRRPRGAGFRLVLAALEQRAWQREAELTELLGYHAGRTLRRLHLKGAVRRRLGEGVRPSFEYALPKATEATRG